MDKKESIRDFVNRIICNLFGHHVVTVAPQTLNQPPSMYLTYCERCHQVKDAQLGIWVKIPTRNF